MNYIILLAPSEEKAVDIESISQNTSDFLCKLWEGDILFQHRKRIYECYLNYLKELLTTLDSRILLELCGTKKLGKNIELYGLLEGVYELKPALERYKGVAFQALDYENLDPLAKAVLHEKLLIFSNLFGVIRGNDPLPFYKLKQNAKLVNLTLKEVYDGFKPVLDSKKWDFAIDLRAGIYVKIWSPKNCPTLNFEFYNNGKIISHYSKLYRGKLLSQIASYLAITKNPKLANLLDFLESLGDSRNDLSLKDITKSKESILIKYEVLHL